VRPLLGTLLLLQEVSRCERLQSGHFDLEVGTAIAVEFREDDRAVARRARVLWLAVDEAARASKRARAAEREGLFAARTRVGIDRGQIDLVEARREVRDDIALPDGGDPSAVRLR